MESGGASAPPKITPAQLSFLAIYNPSLGATEDTLQDQIVYYYSREANVKRKKLESHGVGDVCNVHEEENEKQRQIGLAQGMVNFARSFANGREVDHIETEKSRIVIHELEPNWWILASIDLTRIPVSAAKVDSSQDAKFEYSARELSPPALLTSQLISAYRTFLLHNGTSLSHLYLRLQPSKFHTLLDRFWTRFSPLWDVTLHGTPATDIFGGMKLAAGGELGIGVGEEEWGSGEREVLEDFTRRTLGLVDLLVARFGDVAPNLNAETAANAKSKKDGITPEPWLGVGRVQQAPDGVLFSGMGAVSRESMKDISEWIRSVYFYGESAYGVRDSPISDRKRRKKTGHSSKPSVSMQMDKGQSVDPPPGIPRSILVAADHSLDIATTKVENKQQSLPTRTKEAKSKSPTRESDFWTKYLTLGYGTAWGVSAVEVVEQSKNTSKSPEDILKSRLQAHVNQENAGHFLIGMRGDPEDESDEIDDNSESTDGWNKRLMIRTLHVSMNNTSRLEPLICPNLVQQDASSQGEFRSGSVATITPLSMSSSPTKKTTRLRVVLYVHRPFMYVLLFDPATVSLSIPPFYRHLHTFLSALRDLLMRSTGAAIARRRLTSNPGVFPPQIASQEGVWAAVHDVDSLRTWSSLPAIPAMVGVEGSSAVPEWARTDALNVHMTAIDVLCGIGEDERERSSKTVKGWWVVWARQRRESESAGQEESTTPHSSSAEDYFGDINQSGTSVNGRKAGDREILIVRRARDADSKLRAVSGWGMGGDSSKLDAARMGIGFDPRKYMEGIVRLGR